MAKSKDSYWFRHDSTSGRGLRLKKIQHLYKHWGKGVYWDVIEVLREQSGYKYECDELGMQMLGELIGVDDSEKFGKWFKDCVSIDLFKIKGKFFYSEVLINNMKNWTSKKTNGSKGGRPKTETKKNLNKSESKAKSNRIETIREEDIREEEKTEDKIIEYYFRINDVQYSDKLSKFFPKEFPGFYEQWLMKNDASLAFNVLEKLDTDFMAYTFRDRNHLQNTFKSVWRDVSNSKNNNPLGKIETALRVNEQQDEELKNKYKL